MAPKSGFVLVFLAIFSSCSFSLEHPQSTVTIDLRGPSSRLELFPGSQMFSIEPPSNSSQFDCLVVNVVGLGIAPAYGPAAQLAFLEGVYAGHSCSYPGVSAIVPNSGQSRVTVKVPSGPRRVVQVGGVTKGASDMCQKTSIQPPSNSSGLAFFELGRATIDLFRDAAVQVDENYNTLSPSAQSERLMTCSDPNNGAAYLALIQGTPGLLSYWPLVESVGTTAADLEYGTVPGAVGNMTLTTYTSVSDGPPGIGFPAIHAGVGGISATSGASFGTGDFSVEFWTRYTGACQDGAGVFFVMRHSGAALIQFKCNGANQMIFGVEDNSGPTAQAISAGAVNDGQWHHIAGVKQGNSVYLYVDAGTPTTGSTTFVNNFNFTISPLTQIGQDTVFGEYQNADYAQVAIYSTALTMAQVTDHMTAGD